MAHRRWIVGVRERGCQDYSCNAPRGKVMRGAKTSLNAEAGVYRYGCPVCGKTSEVKLSAFKDKRDCKDCHRVRDVTVHLHADGEEYFAKCCNACDAMRSAAVHLATAKRLAAKALEIYERYEVDAPAWAPYRRTSPDR